MRNLRNLLRLNSRKGEFRAEGNTIYIYDVIVADEFEAEWMGGVSPKAFIDALKAMNGDVQLRINSPGGDVFGANAISQAIREYDRGQVIAHVDGVAASAASVVAVNAGRLIMAPGSMLMIHNAWTMVAGDKNDMNEWAALLAKVDGMIADQYALKSSGDTGTFATLMDAETWFTPEEALAIGLVDEIAKSPDKAKASARWDLSAFTNLPQDLAPVTTVTTTKTVTVTTEEETETETVTVTEGDPSTLPPEALSGVEIAARRRALEARLRLNAA